MLGKTTTNSMKAIVQNGYGPPERVLELATVERPAIGDHDVLIRVRATSVNTPDWVTVAGVPNVVRLKSGLRQPSTPVRGTDLAGIMAAAGKNVTDLRPGDEVFGSLFDNKLVTHPPARLQSSQSLRRPGSSASPSGSRSKRLPHRSCRASPR